MVGPARDFMRRLGPARVECDQGWITATPGETTDFSIIEADIKTLGERHDLTLVVAQRCCPRGNRT